MAAVMQHLGVGKGDRVLIYMPMIQKRRSPCSPARASAIHWWFWVASPQGRWRRASTTRCRRLIVSSDAGMRGGKPVPYKHLLDDAIELATHKAGSCADDRSRPRPGVQQGRGATSTTRACANASFDADVPVTWLESSSRRTSSIPLVRPASRRAFSAIPAATRSRWPRRCSTSIAAARARRCSRPRISAGSSATPILSMAVDRRHVDHV